MNGPPVIIVFVRFALLLGFAVSLGAQTGADVLLVVNKNSEASRQIGEYYRPRRSIPVANVCTIATSEEEEIGWTVYEKEIEQPIGECLKKARLVEKALYIVTTLGVPLKIDGAGSGLMSEHSSVDSELALLYSKLKGAKFQRAGWVPNPMFGKRDTAFRHPAIPIYIVARLAAYDLADVKAMIDRSLTARNRGKFVLDLASAKDEQGNNWLRTAGLLLAPDRTTLDASQRVLLRQTDVIAYASWGSNDEHRTDRWLNF